MQGNTFKGRVHVDEREGAGNIIKTLSDTDTSTVFRVGTELEILN